jgi:hypothetical protein
MTKADVAAGMAEIEQEAPKIFTGRRFEHRKITQ